MWCRHFLEEVYRSELKPVMLRVDNQSAIRLVKNNQIHSKIKQLDIRMLAVRERDKNKWIDVEYINTLEEVADMLTKPLPPKRFKYLCSRMGLVASIICMLLLICSNTNALRIKMNSARSDTSVQQHRLTLKINSPCKQVEEAEQSVRGTLLLNEEGKFNASVMELTKFMCTSIFNEKVITAMHELDDCLYRTRSKRDLASVVTVASTVASIILGVTNLIEGSSEENTELARKDVLSHLANRVSDSSKTILMDRVLKNLEEEREIEIESQTANRHIQQIKEKKM